MDITIRNLQVVKFEKSNFVKPFSVYFEMNGKKRSWDCVKVHDSVSILMYNVDRDAFLLVKQFRPPVWFYQNEHGVKNNEIGYSYELCAGILDKNLSLKETAIEEIYEETGYNVKELEYITSCYSSLGFAANKQSIFYAKIYDNDLVAKGGGTEDENIEIFYLPTKKAEEFIYNKDIIRAPSLLFSFLWFFRYKCDENGVFKG